MQPIEFATDAEWHALRAEDVTSTESPALFGLSPYLTEYELHWRKRERSAVQMEPTERMTWGLRLQGAIAAGVAEDKHWLIEDQSRRYYRHPKVPRMGCSLDYIARDVARLGDTYGIMEVKNLDALAYRDGWMVHDDGEIEAPAHIELQVQHQLEVTGLGWAAIVALVGGNTARVLLRERDAKIGSRIVSAIGAFWRDVDAGKPPAPDFARDADFVRARHQAVTPRAEPVDLRANNRLAEVCAAYKRAAAAESAARTEKEAAGAEILTLIGDADRAMAQGFTISAGIVAGGPVAYERKPYRNLRVYEKKDAKNAA